MARGLGTDRGAGPSFRSGAVVVAGVVSRCGRCAAEHGSSGNRRLWPIRAAVFAPAANDTCRFVSGCFCSVCGYWPTSARVCCSHAGGAGHRPRCVMRDPKGCVWEPLCTYLAIPQVHWSLSGSVDSLSVCPTPQEPGGSVRHGPSAHMTGSSCFRVGWMGCLRGRGVTWWAWRGMVVFCVCVLA